MSLYAIEQKWLGIGKETARGTSVNPAKFYPIGPDTELEYKLNHIEDELLRGKFENYPPYAGTKEGAGTLILNANAMNLGEFLHSLLGSVDSSQISGGLAYQHIFTRSTEIELPSYTISINRGVAAKKYPLSVVKSIAFGFPSDNIVKATISTIFKSEEDYVTPPTPTFTELNPFMFHQVVVKIGGNTYNYVKEINLTVDNGSAPMRVLSGSQDIYNVISATKLNIAGSFNIYIESETERNNFLANTNTSLEIIATGALIETGNNYLLDINIPQIHYTAAPYINLDGLVGLGVNFSGYYKQSANDSISIKLVNTITSY